MKSIYVIHPEGSPEHFRALAWLVEQQFSESYRLCFVEFGLLVNSLRAIKRIEIGKLFKQLLNFIYLVKLLFKNRKQKIVIGIAPYDWRLILLFKILSKHEVYYFTSWPFWDGQRPAKRLLFNSNRLKCLWRSFIEGKVNGICTVTEAARKDLLAHYDVNVPIIKVGHSYDRRHFFPRETLEEVNNSINKPIRCLFVGRLCYQKGIDRILRVITELPAREFEFCFVGRGPESCKIQEFSKSHSNVSRVGYVNDKLVLGSILNQSDILLLPSRKTMPWEELFGMVIVEGMACGLLPIATTHVGPSEIIQNGHNGYLFDESEYVNSTVPLLSSLSRDRGRLQKLRASALISAKQYCVEEVSKKWVAVF